MSGGQKQSGVTLRSDLRDVVQELQFEELGLVGDKILPPVTVSKTHGEYPVIPKEAVAKIPDISRSPDGTFKRGQWDWKSSTFETEFTGYEEEVDLVQAKIDMEWIDEEEISAQKAKQGLYLGNEQRVASKLFNLTTFAGTTITNPNSTYFDGTNTDLHLNIINEFDDATNARPFAVIDTAYKVLRSRTLLGKKQFTAIMSDDVVSNMLQSDELQDAVKYVEPVATMTDERKRSYLASYLGIKGIIPVSAWYDAASLSKESEFSQFWSDEYILLAKLSNGGKSIAEECLGRQPIWSGHSFEIDTYEERNKMKRIYRASQQRGIKVITRYGILLTNATTHG